MTGKVATVFGGAFLFLLCPYLLIFLAKQAYTGLFKGTTLTHFGLRSGWIARLYGVFYLLMFTLYVFEVVTIAAIFLNLGASTILQILLNREPVQPDLGILFISLGLFFMMLIWWLIKFRTPWVPSLANDSTRMRAIKLYFCALGFAMLLLGCLKFFASPLWLYVLIPVSPLYILLALGIKPEDIYPPAPAQK